jgi:lipopolysaccharide export system permease protein
VFFAEGHNKISSPLYCILFALIALVATAKAHLGRTSYALRLLTASLIAVGLRLAGYAAQGIAVADPNFVFLLYVIPLGAAAVAGAMFAGMPLVPGSLKRLLARSKHATA